MMTPIKINRYVIQLERYTMIFSVMTSILVFVKIGQTTLYKQEISTNNL